jgi:hypothetical protein
MADIPFYEMRWKMHRSEIATGMIPSTAVNIALTVTQPHLWPVVVLVATLHIWSFYRQMVRAQSALQGETILILVRGTDSKES